MKLLNQRRDARGAWLKKLNREPWFHADYILDESNQRFSALKKMSSLSSIGLGFININAGLDRSNIAAR